MFNCQGWRHRLELPTPIRSQAARLMPPFQDLCDPRFAPLLKPCQGACRSASTVSAVGLWPDLSIAYLSAGWFAFSAANQGEPAISQRWQLGDSWLSGISGPLRLFFRQAAQHVLADQQMWEHWYECSSPMLFRNCRTIIHPLPNHAGLLVVNSLCEERPHQGDRLLTLPPEKAFRDRQGLLHQCNYCRRVRQAERPARWVWIRDLVEAPPASVAPGICEACFAAYQPNHDPRLAFPEPIPWDV